jgi:uncharacterized GH25 family protein
MKLEHLPVGLWALCLAGMAHAHEFWLWPDDFAPEAGQPVVLSLRVGEHFTGDLVGFGQPLVREWRVRSRTGERDITASVMPGAHASSPPMAFAQRGSQRLSVDTQSFNITLPPDKFEAYLREEGLERVVAQREAEGASDRPGRERYRRHAKTLLRVGGQADASALVPTGQVLEIVPLTDPHMRSGAKGLQMQVRHQGNALPAALVKAWHQGERQLTVLRARTDCQGRVRFDLPWDGAWMVSVVHMVRTTGDADIDWDSHWANLTFEVGPAR